MDYIYSRYWRSSNSQLDSAAYLNTGTGWRRAAGYRLPYALTVNGSSSTGAQFVDLKLDM